MSVARWPDMGARVYLSHQWRYNSQNYEGLDTTVFDKILQRHIDTILNIFTLKYKYNRKYVNSQKDSTYRCKYCSSVGNGFPFISSAQPQGKFPQYNCKNLCSTWGWFPTGCVATMLWQEESSRENVTALLLPGKVNRVKILTALLLKASWYLRYDFYSCTKQLAWEASWEERVYSAYTSMLLFISKGGQDWN